MLEINELICDDLVCKELKILRKAEQMGNSTMVRKSEFDWT
jgi:hypothetical protein